MRRFGSILGIAAGLIGGAGASANAAAVTYTFNPARPPILGTSFTFPDGGMGDLTGSFTINPPSQSFSAEDDVVIKGGAEAGTYAPVETVGQGVLVYATREGATVEVLEVGFTPNLDSVPVFPVLENVTWQVEGTGPEFKAVAVSGGATLERGATLVPEPSTWAMMLLGFGGLGYAGYRRIQKGQAPTA